MKVIFSIIIATFAASFALSPASVVAEDFKGGPTTYLVQIDGATVAILPYNPKRTMSVCCSGNAEYNKDTGVMSFTNKVELVASVPDQAAITITGDHLTLQPQK